MTTNANNSNDDGDGSDNNTEFNFPPDLVRIDFVRRPIPLVLLIL